MQPQTPRGCSKLVKSFQSDDIGSYASREDFAEEIAKMENKLPDFALRCRTPSDTSAMGVLICP